MMLVEYIAKCLCGFKEKRGKMVGLISKEKGEKEKVLN